MLIACFYICYRPVELRLRQSSKCVLGQGKATLSGIRTCVLLDGIKTCVLLDGTQPVSEPCTGSLGNLLIHNHPMHFGSDSSAHRCTGLCTVLCSANWTSVKMLQMQQSHIGPSNPLEQQREGTIASSCLQGQCLHASSVVSTTNSSTMADALLVIMAS